MESNKTVNASPTNMKSDAHPNAVTCATSAAPAGVGETAGRSKGAAIGGAIGHAIGVGADVVVGAVAGGIAAGKNAMGKTAAEPANPVTEHEFWRKEFMSRPYFTQGTPYEQYGPAFQYGWVSYASNQGKTFNEVEPQLGLAWESRRAQSKLSWNHAKGATHDAWQRAEKAACGTPCTSA